MRFSRGLFWLALACAGCGGSSSETPPPLQPDPAMRRYTGPRVAQAGEQPEEEAEPAGAAPSPEVEQGEGEAAAPAGSAPAPATWGAGKPSKPAPAAPAAR